MVVTSSVCPAPPSPPIWKSRQGVTGWTSGSCGGTKPQQKQRPCQRERDLIIERKLNVVLPFCYPIRLDVGRPDDPGPFLGFVHDELAEGGGRTHNHGAVQLGDAPNFENRTQGGPWRGRCGRRDPSRQPDPLDFGARFDYPKAYPRQFITAL
jgi:hypothetical protein